MNFGAAIALLCIGMVIYQLSSGKVVGRGGWVTTRDKNPGLYWLTIAIGEWSLMFAVQIECLAMGNGPYATN
jgi:hypothetical protein